MFRTAAPTARTYANVTMYVGMISTLAGNALAADWSDPIGVVISAFPALALLVVFEMVVRSKANPSRRRWYHQAMRIVPAAVIMGIAAKTSYGHLLQVSVDHGQHGLNAYLMAALPDAMMILATVVLKDSPATRKPAVRKAPAVAKAPATRKPAARKPATPKATTKAAGAAAIVPTRTAVVPVLLTASVPARRRVAINS